MIKLAAFDMAGTTIDDHGHVYAALDDAVRETGVRVRPEDLQRWMGADKVAAIAALMELGGAVPEPAVVAAAFDRFRAILVSRYAADCPVALPGVEEAIAELRRRGIKVALTTGFSEDVAAPLLTSLGWTVGPGVENTVDAVVTSSEVLAGRPAPYMIHRAMEKTAIVDVRTVLAAGDTVVDVLAAVNAGVVSVGVLTGKLRREDLAVYPHDYILASVADVPGLADTQPA